MTTQQKSAWYQLLLGLATATAYVLLLELAGAAVAPAAMTLMAPIGLVPVLFRREVRDERERLIARSSLIVGGMMAYLFVGAVCMLVWWSRYRQDPPTVDVALLPLIFLGAAVVMTVARAMTVLVLDRRHLDQTGP